VNKALIILGIIVIVAITAILISISVVSDSENVNTLTDTPADNYQQNEREKFCGTGQEKSNTYVTEYQIPTECTQPQAITVDSQGNVWFVQSNTGNIAKFDPISESFTEYNNGLWPRGDNSMIWGLEYSSDGFLWFTDDKHGSVWKFEISTKKYSRLNTSGLDTSYPQKIQFDNSKLIINDFTGGQIVFLDDIHSDVVTYSLPSNAENSVVADFAIDSQNNLWYTNWVLDGLGILAKINMTSFEQSLQNNEDLLEFEMFTLPPEMKTPNGIAEDNRGNIWIADSSSSLLYRFNTTSEEFSKYPTAKSSPLTYGNFTGKITSADSKPYWLERDSEKIIFNLPGANSIGVLDPVSEKLITYSIPSTNHHWGDCQEQKNCGISQAFDFAINGQKIWFTEWAQNNIGVIDTTISIPIDVEIDVPQVTILPGESLQLNFITTTDSQFPIEVYPIIENPDSGNNLTVKTNTSEKPVTIHQDDSLVTSIELSASDESTSGEYKILLGSRSNDVYVGKFLTVLIV
jgi:virginiamycin B lyase